MADSRADKLLQRADRLKSKRANLDSLWQDIAEIMAPLRADFTVKRMPGEKRMQKVFDGTGIIAGNNLAAGLYGSISSPSNDWFELEHEDSALNEDQEVKTWLADAADRMRKVFNGNGGRFYAKLIPQYRDLVFFGTSVFYAEKVPGRASLFFSNRHLAECYLDQNAYEEVDTVFRRFKVSGRQAEQLFPDSLPARISDMNAKDPDHEWDFVHAVLPNEDYRPGLLGPRGKRFASIWICCESREIVREAGYSRFPFMTPRWSMPSAGVYGDSQAQLVLPDQQMLNALRKVNLVGLQKVVAPTILAADEEAMRGFNQDPNGIVYGGLDEMGNARYKPLVSGARIDIGAEYEKQIQDAIREGFMWSLLLMVSRPGATATEVLAQQDEKLRLMGPNLGMVQSELLDPTIDWTFATMLEEGAFPPLPQKLLDYPVINVNYVSPLARAQKVGEGAALVRALDALGPLGQIKQQVYDNVDEDDYAREVFDAFGAKPKVLRDPKAVAAIRQQTAQKEDIANMTNSAMPVSGAVKNMAQAQAAITAARNPGQGAAA